MVFIAKYRNITLDWLTDFGLVLLSCDAALGSSTSTGCTFYILLTNHIF